MGGAVMKDFHSGLDTATTSELVSTTIGANTVLHIDLVDMDFTDFLWLLTLCWTGLLAVYSEPGW